MISLDQCKYWIYSCTLISKIMVLNPFILNSLPNLRFEIIFVKGVVHVLIDITTNFIFYNNNFMHECNFMVKIGHLQ